MQQEFCWLCPVASEDYPFSFFPPEVPIKYFWRMLKAVKSTHLPLDVFTHNLVLVGGEVSEFRCLKAGLRAVVICRRSIWKLDAWNAP